MMQRDEEELWRNIPHYFGFQISDMGRVRKGEDNYIESYRSRIYNEPWVSFEYFEYAYRGPVWRLMLVGFYDMGNFRTLEPEYRDGDPFNVDIFNLTWISKETGLPILFRREANGDWKRIRHTGRRVRVIETGDIFSSVRQCAYELGLSSNTIYMCLRGEQKTHHGLSFEYAD